MLVVVVGVCGVGGVGLTLQVLVTSAKCDSAELRSGRIVCIVFLFLFAPHACGQHDRQFVYFSITDC